MISLLADCDSAGMDLPDGLAESNYCQGFGIGSESHGVHLKEDCSLTGGTLNGKYDDFMT
ncbi:hypothetical protein [Paucimonas lemoignei]|uniref:hypothetical protein n=1 Tax=Paucimonas lemoignei TaxID=29443 RepID=UPI001051D811|nr:hypothetical protein [Paucimonas lemoignei]